MEITRPKGLESITNQMAVYLEMNTTDIDDIGSDDADCMNRWCTSPLFAEKKIDHKWWIRIISRKMNGDKLK